ncbi:hypothetical protein XENOCAPTIV_019832 [Xenoophorus captivus]|uniref:Uncharacterized protein n=1 Tax=Xenoophorus captivus TaxID=1517983 RepID=A0ABV0R1G6_9TELE
MSGKSNNHLKHLMPNVMHAGGSVMIQGCFTAIGAGTMQPFILMIPSIYQDLYSQKILRVLSESSYFSLKIIASVSANKCAPSNQWKEPNPSQDLLWIKKCVNHDDET